jgi:hypothetical protein
MPPAETRGADEKIIFSDVGEWRNQPIKEHKMPMAEIRYFRPAGPGPAWQNATLEAAPTRGSAANPEKYCVYNQTRERFAATDVEAAGASPDGAEARLRALEQGAGTGLWILPYQGISPTSVRFPVDLVFLDNDCVVLATVESFPLAALPDSSANARSMLALQAETVATGGMRAGDQLIISDPEAMKRHLQRVKGANAEAPIAPAPVKAEIAAPVRAEIAAPVRAEIACREAAGAEELAASPPIELGVWKKRLGTRSWFTNLLLGDPADPRKALREVLPGLIAYFFTGGTPAAHEVRDISATGVYIITNEGWYPGTVVRVTLTDRDYPTADRSITVNAKAMRKGSDGVGLEFILERENQEGTAMSQTFERTLGVNQARVEAFLQELKRPPSQK